MTEVSNPSEQQPGDAPLTVFLHIGTMKTGTSFVQSVLLKNREVLRDEGVLYPLRGNQWALQVKAARDILGIKGLPSEGGWAAQAEKIDAWDGRAVVVSMEFYSLASAAKAKQVVASLRPAKVEIILTARDLVRVLPSAWQSMIKQGRPWPFNEFVSAVIDQGAGDPDAHRRFWRHQDVVDIARKWVGAVGADNVHLITVPPSGAAPSLLWERFCGVIGVEPSRYDISQDRNSNFSLSYSDTELMRQVSGALYDDLGKLPFKRWATHYFANRVLRASAAEDTAHDRPRLSSAAQDWAIRRSQAMVEDLRGMGLHVVGDLSELVPRESRPASGADEAAPLTSYPDGAVAIIAALLRRIAEVDPGQQAGERSSRKSRAAGSDNAEASVDDDAYDDVFDDDPSPRLASSR